MQSLLFEVPWEYWQRGLLTFATEESAAGGGHFRASSSRNMVTVSLRAAILAVLSQMVLAAAYARASASTLIPLEYSAFLWACLFGWWFFDEALTVPVLTGAALIVMACMIAAREQPHLAAHVEAESA